MMTPERLAEVRKELAGMAITTPQWEAVDAVFDDRDELAALVREAKEALRKHIARLNEELDRERERSASFQADANAAQEALARQSEVVRMLTEALGRYGDHNSRCAKWRMTFDPVDCDCGLDAALKAAAERKEQ